MESIERRTEEGRYGVEAYLTLALSVQGEVESHFRLLDLGFFGAARRGLGRLEEVGLEELSLNLGGESSSYLPRAY